MNILLINGHKWYPYSQGKLNKTLFNAIYEILNDNYSIFTTIVENGYNTKEEIDKFLKSDIIIFQTPINWFSFPWSLKQYIDDVYRHGIFFGPSDEYGQGGLLKNKKYMYSLTMNSPAEAFGNKNKFYNGKKLDEVIYAMHKVQEYSGLRQIETFAAYDVIKNPNVKLYLKQLENHLKRYIFSN